MNNLVYILNRIALPIILIGAALFQLINLEAVEFNFIEFNKLGWTIGTILLRFVILLEIFLAFSILFNVVKPRILSALLLPLSVLYIYDLLLKTGASNHSTLSLMSFPVEIINVAGTILVLIGTIVLFFASAGRQFSLGKKIIINVIFLAISSTVTFIFDPVFIDDYLESNVAVESPKLDWAILSNKNNDLKITNEKPVFYCFFSTSCYYCNKAAKMLGISNRISEPKQNIVMIFPGNKKDTEEFIERNKCDFPYARISQDEFIKLAGNSYPSFFMVSNQKETHHWTGRTLNYREIDKLFK